MPAVLAALRAGATASVPSAEMAMALTPWVVGVLDERDLRSAFGLARADLCDRAAELAAALSAPVLAASKYGLTICLGCSRR